MKTICTNSGNRFLGLYAFSLNNLKTLPVDLLLCFLMLSLESVYFIANSPVTILVFSEYIRG